MASLDSLQVRAALARGIVGQVFDDMSVAIRLKYIGTGTVTSVTVTQATNIVMITSDGGTDTYTFATYATIGALVAAINRDGIFTARVLDALNSAATDDAFIAGAITISNGYYDVLSDTSAAGALFLAYCVTYTREVGVNTKLASGHRVHLQSIQYNITFGGGVDAKGIKVYERDLQSGAEVLLFAALPVDATLTTITWASGQGKITGGENKELIVQAMDATSVTGVLTATGIAE